MDILLLAGKAQQAERLLKLMPQILSGSDAIETAILARRMDKAETAHRYFERAGDAILYDSRALHEFAQTKMQLAQKNGKQKNVSNRLMREARELLERVIQQDADKVRHAWAWRDLAKVKTWLKSPATEIVTAYQSALTLMPDEAMFQNELARFSARNDQS